MPPSKKEKKHQLATLLHFSTILAVSRILSNVIISNVVISIVVVSLFFHHNKYMVEKDFAKLAKFCHV